MLGELELGQLGLSLQGVVRVGWGDTGLVTPLGTPHHWCLCFALGLASDVLHTHTKAVAVSGSQLGEGNELGGRRNIHIR